MFRWGNRRQRGTPTTQESPRRRPAALEAGPEEHWYGVPDWWTAGFTGALFVATTGLWVFTGFLWWTTRRAVRDGAASIKAAETSAQALTRAEKAYLSGGGSAFRGTIEEQGNAATVAEPYGVGRPNVFKIDLNNYGKTPGDLIEIHIGFWDLRNGTVPETVPPIRVGDVYYFRDWIRPDTASRPIRYIWIPPHLQQPVIFGRIYYRDVIFKELFSVGFILEIVLQTWVTRPIRAAETYTEERDEPTDQPPTIGDPAI
jgi:hypothetical protein